MAPGEGTSASLGSFHRREIPGCLQLCEGCGRVCAVGDCSLWVLTLSVQLSLQAATGGLQASKRSERRWLD